MPEEKKLGSRIVMADPDIQQIEQEPHQGVDESKKHWRSKCYPANDATPGSLPPDEYVTPTGVALFIPDEVRESFVPSTDHGGNDTARGSVRYVQWTTDPDPSDTTILVDFGILLRDEQGAVRVLHERHTHGLFARSVWLRLLRKVGFKPTVVRDEYVRDVFLARRPL